MIPSSRQHRCHLAIIANMSLHLLQNNCRMELLDLQASPMTTWGTGAFMHVAQNGRLGVLGRQNRKREGRCRSCNGEVFRDYSTSLFMTKFCALRPSKQALCVSNPVSAYTSRLRIARICVCCTVVDHRLNSRTVPVSSPFCSNVRCGCNPIYASQTPKHRPWTFKLGVIPDLGHRHLGNTKTFGSG